MDGRHTSLTGAKTQGKEPILAARPGLRYARLNAQVQIALCHARALLSVNEILFHYKRQSHSEKLVMRAPNSVALVARKFFFCLGGYEEQLEPESGGYQGPRALVLLTMFRDQASLKAVSKARGVEGVEV